MGSRGERPSGRPVRTMVVWCPDWPVVAAGARPSEPVVVVRANRVVAATPAARAAGVAVGQRRRQAQGACPEVVVHEHDDGRDARAFEAVVQAVEAFTPRLELGVPGRVAFGTRGPSRYFGGDVALAGQVQVAVDAVLAVAARVGPGWSGHVRIGVADGPTAALLAARLPSAPGAGGHGAEEHGVGEQGGGERGSGVDPGRIRIVAPGASGPFLAPLLVTALDRPDLADLLVRLGLPTLGDLAALDPAAVLARFGPDGLRAHRLAAGLDEHPPDERLPPPDLVVAAELDPPAERVDVAAFVAKALADELHERLSALALHCTRVLVSAETEHGEVLERLWSHEGAMAAGAMADRVRWQLDGWLNGPTAHRPTSGVTLLRLAPDEVVPAHGRQLGFWGGETGADERVVRAVARVQGLLGMEAVTVPEHTGGRGPAERVARVPAAAVDLAAGRPTARGPAVPAPWPGAVPPPWPALVHDPALPVEVVDAGERRVAVSGRGLLSAPPARVLPGGGAGAMAAGDGRGRSLSGDEAVSRGASRPDRSPVAAGDHGGRVRSEGDWGPGPVRSPSSLSVRGSRVVAWAGPWPTDERWWDVAAQRRRARLQVVLDDGRVWLLALETGTWGVEATYD